MPAARPIDSLTAWRGAALSSGGASSPALRVAAVRRAGETVVSASAFLIERYAAAGCAMPAARTIGNALRELDRFLNLLLDAVASLAPAIDRPRFVRQHNAANKLRALCLLIGAARPDHARLAAIGRVREWLYRRGGLEGAAIRGALHLAGGSGTGDRFDAAALAAICAFYRDVARDLIAAAAAHGLLDPRFVDEGGAAPYVAHANVACDGI